MRVRGRRPPAGVMEAGAAGARVPVSVLNRTPTRHSIEVRAPRREPRAVEPATSESPTRAAPRPATPPRNTAVSAYPPHAATPHSREPPQPQPTDSADTTGHSGQRTPAQVTTVQRKENEEIEKKLSGACELYCNRPPRAHLTLAHKWHIAASQRWPHGARCRVSGGECDHDR